MRCRRSILVQARLLVAIIVALALSVSFTVAQDIELSGKLEVKISDGLDFSHSKTEYALRTSRGRKIRLAFVRSPGELLTGQYVTIRGRKLNAATMRVGASKRNLSITGDGPSGITGVQTVVVLRIQSTSSVSPTNLSQLAAEVAAVDVRAREHSFNLLSVSNDKNNDGTADVYTVSVNVSSAGLTEFDAFNLCTQAKTNAAVSGYSHYVCILPPDMTYSWYGQAYIGGQDMVINGNYASGYPNGLEHEMAHNWGRHHSNTTGVEYGDSTCIMGGNAGTADRHFNGPQKLGLGWLSAVDASSGTYSIKAVEESTGTRLLKIRDQVAGQDLYISTRARVGNYSTGPINPGTTQVHEWAGFSNKTTLLATLSTGQTFSRNGFSITQSAYAGTTATIVITGLCTRVTPLVSVDPVRFTSGSLVPYSFSASVQNRDLDCGATNFSLNVSSSNPALAGSPSSATMNLTSGQTGSVNLDAAPGGNLGVGVHTLTLAVSDANHTTASADAEYDYQLATPTPTNLPNQPTATPTEPGVPPPTSTPGVAVPTSTPTATPTLVATQTPQSVDKVPPRVKARDIRIKRRNSAVINYSVSDNSDETSEIIQISRNSKILLKHRTQLAAIPASQRRSVLIHTPKLTAGSYILCVTAIDGASNKASDCSSVLVR